MAAVMEEMGNQAVVVRGAIVETAEQQDRRGRVGQVVAVAMALLFALVVVIFTPLHQGVEAELGFLGLAATELLE
jgi:hypothetical protein